MGLRARLLLLVLLPTIPALLLALYTNLQLRRMGAARVEKDAMKVVQWAAASQNGLVEATRLHLSEPRAVLSQPAAPCPVDSFTSSQEAFKRFAI